jgi:hypothetical protein
MTAVRIVSADGETHSPPVATGEVPGALLDRLRRSASRVRDGRTLDKPVPGFEGALLLRFKPLDIGQLERMIEMRNAAARGSASEISESIDALATCCIGVYADDNGTRSKLDAGLDNRLAELLGWPIPLDAQLSTREVFVTLFGGEAFAISNFVDEVVQWMTHSDGNGQPLGEG